MMIHRTFTRLSGAPIRERRRRRWADTLATVAVVVGIVLDRAANDATLPHTWQPYIRTAAIVFGAVAMIERIERRHDYRRYVRRITREQSTNADA